MAEVQLRHRFLLYIYKIKPVSNHLVGNWFLYPIRLFSPLRTSLIFTGRFLIYADILKGFYNVLNVRGKGRRLIWGSGQRSRKIPRRLAGCACRAGPMPGFAAKGRKRRGIFLRRIYAFRAFRAAPLLAVILKSLQFMFSYLMFTRLLKRLYASSHFSGFSGL